MAKYNHFIKCTTILYSVQFHDLATTTLHTVLNYTFITAIVFLNLLKKSSKFYIE